MTSTLDDLDSVAIRIIWRLARGERVDTTNRHRGLTTAASYQKVLDRGLVTEHSTPKRKKRWFELTPAGHTLIPAVQEHDRQRDAKMRESMRRAGSAARLRDAAPELLEALQNAVALWAYSSTDAPQLAWLGQARAAIAKATQP